MLAPIGWRRRRSLGRDFIGLPWAVINVADIVLVVGLLWTALALLAALFLRGARQYVVQVVMLRPPGAISAPGTAEEATSSGC